MAAYHPLYHSGGEHGRSSACVAGQPFDHLADLLSAGFREADAAFDSLGGERHQALLDDVAGIRAYAKGVPA
jgi:hypothetical protein